MKKQLCRIYDTKWGADEEEEEGREELILTRRKVHSLIKRNMSKRSIDIEGGVCVCLGVYVCVHIIIVFYYNNNNYYY